MCKKLSQVEDKDGDTGYYSAYNPFNLALAAGCNNHRDKKKHLGTVKALC